MKYKSVMKVGQVDRRLGIRRIRYSQHAGSRINCLISLFPSWTLPIRANNFGYLWTNLHHPSSQSSQGTVENHQVSPQCPKFHIFYTPENKHGNTTLAKVWFRWFSFWTNGWFSGSAAFSINFAWQKTGAKMLGNFGGVWCWSWGNHLIWSWSWGIWFEWYPKFLMWFLCPKISCWIVGSS